MLRRTVRLGLLAAALAPASAHAAVVATHIGDFHAPTYITAPPGDTRRVFVVEQPGTIRIIKDGVTEGTPFLDITGIVSGPSHYPGDPEQGLLSMAFAPDYATSGRFYVYYTSTNCPTEPGCDNVIAAYTAADADHANTTGHVLLTLPHPSQPNHNGGQLQFGPDGDLYISTGDGGGNNDSQRNAQQTSNLLGKILRISPGTTSYSIPAGNPFGGSECSTGSSGGSPCPEIWSYGLRNPWRFSFDSTTGDLIIGDVGQDRDEEIDYAHPGQDVGANYGWPCYEGFELNASRPSSECSPLPSPVTSPVLAYHHSCAGASFCGEGVIGGYVMHDPSLPSLEGCYVYGDLSTSRLRVARLAQPAALADADLGPSVSNLSSFGQDASGHLWAADVSGPVYRLDSTGDAATTPTCLPAPAAKDTTPAVLALSRRRRQHVLRTHYIRIAVRPNEAASIIARATVRITHTARKLRFRRAARRARAGQRVTLKLKLSKRALRSVRRRLRHHRSLVAKVTVTSRDASGNVSRGKHTSVVLVR